MYHSADLSHSELHVIIRAYRAAYIIPAASTECHLIDPGCDQSSSRCLTPRDLPPLDLCLYRTAISIQVFQINKLFTLRDYSNVGLTAAAALYSWRIDTGTSTRQRWYA